ncbi:MAG: tRNA pseudouridine(13) synthase TruD [Planctomycetota bacterium]
MRIKQRVGDFRVRELLVDGCLLAQGEHRVYRVTKRKLTTPEAARILAAEAGVDVGEVEFAGLKDRQAITIQHMSVAGGRDVRMQSPELKIDTAGFAAASLTAESSRGNAFELTVRALRRDELVLLRRSLPIVREHGLVNYFDDQRFGNLKHGQGWIAAALMRGRHEEALRTLLSARSPHDDPRRARFKDEIVRAWGDWRACRDVAGRFGQHHSVFEHLTRTGDDFAGAFYHVATQLRLIHLYAFQSHLWNRAVVELVRDQVPVGERLALASEEGPLVTYAGAPPPDLAARAAFRLPGAGFNDVADRVEYDLLEDALAREELVPDAFRVEGVPGFQLKGEARPLLVHPRHLRVRPAEEDELNRGHHRVRIRFELPRGAYATLVVKRLFARPVAEERRRARQRAAHPRAGSGGPPPERRPGPGGEAPGRGRRR